MLQVPLWLFLTSVLIALSWPQMASLLFTRSTPLPLASSFLRGIKPSFLPSFLQQTSYPHIIPSSITNNRNKFHPLNQYSTTAAMASKSASFLSDLKGRRTYYALKKESTISDAKIQEIIKEVVLHTPSAFNSQSTRIVLLVKAEHDKFWEFVKEAIKAIVTADQWPASEGRLNGFKAGYGTILFFEDRRTVSGMQAKFALYADKFPVWASQSDAMSQYALWTALELEGLGANLQHYNPVVDAKVAAEWGLSEEWELNAQLVFGTPAAEPGEKTFIPVEERFKSFGV